MKNRIPPAVLQADKDALASLEVMPDYDPRNPRHTVAAAKIALTAVTQRQATLAQTEAAFNAARNAVIEAENEFHAIMIGAKAEVRVQYGDDSDQVQAVGLKKKSDRKRPARRTPKPKDDEITGKP